MVRKTRVGGLPPADTTRWVARRKAALVAAVRRGAITREEACRRHALSEEELSSWEWSFDTYGLDGLRIKHLQRYRGIRSSRMAKAASTAATATEQGSSAPPEEDCSACLGDLSAPELV